MATLRQIAANRLNALSSTGPNTEDGKARSRVNALRHGLAGTGVVLPDEGAEAVNSRRDDWRDAYRPESAEQKWLFEQVVINSVRLDHCRARETELRTRLALRAALNWDDDRRLAAEELGASLAKAPARVSVKLRSTSQGCDWLIGRWRALGDALNDGGAWTDAQHELALDLLGTPAEFRATIPPDFETPGAVVSREVARLEAHKAEALDALDDHERAAAEAGLEVAPDKALALLHRYEAECLRRFHWARKALTTHRDIVAVEPAPPSAAEAMSDADWRAYERRVLGPIYAQAIPLEAPEPLPPPPTPSSPIRTTPSLLPLANRRTRRAAEKLCRKR